jgi:uncharacterized protein DUF3667
MTDAVTEPVSVPAASAAATHEPHCRNCGHAIAKADVYCRHCGQETQVTLPTARQFMREAAGRYVALDGRLWRTMKALLRPGFLTREYIDGRRRRYVRPGRLFLVTSIVAFTVIRIATHGDVVAFEAGRTAAQLGAGVAVTPPGSATADDAAKGGVPQAPPAARDHRARRADAAAMHGRRDGAADESVIVRGDDFNVSLDNDLNVHVGGDGPGLSVLRDRVERFNHLPLQAKGEQLVGTAFRYGPYAAIALLPAFALMLKLVYLFATRRHAARPRRFAAHLVFAAHNHAFLFVLATLLVLPWPGWMQGLAVVLAVYYLLRSMRVVYSGGWVSTLVRAFVLFVSYLVLFVFVVFGLLAAAVMLQ